MRVMAALIALLAVPPAASASGVALPVDADALAFVRAHGTAFGAADAPLTLTESSALAGFVGSATVLAIGEPVHAAREPLQFRNRLIRHLVAHEGFTAVALESGFAQGWRVDDYIQGGAGDGRDIVHSNLSWTFGDLASNLELVEWLRAWNAAHPAASVRFYGADISGGGGEAGLPVAGLALDDLVGFLRRAGEAALADRLAAYSGRFTPPAHAAMTSAARDALDAAITAATGVFRDRAAAMTSATSPMAFARAAETLRDVTTLVAVFKVWPAPDNKVPMPAWLRVSELRDRTMADHMLWALAREGPRGRIIGFAANGHVVKADLVPEKPGFEGLKGLKNFGVNMHEALGDHYRVLLQAAAGSSIGKTSTTAMGSIETLLLAAGQPRLLIDWRRGGDWWRQPQTIGAHYDDRSRLVPVAAADGALLIDPLTCDAVTGTAPNECLKRIRK